MKETVQVDRALYVTLMCFAREAGFILQPGIPLHMLSIHPRKLDRLRRILREIDVAIDQEWISSGIGGCNPPLVPAELVRDPDVPFEGSDP